MTPRAILIDIIPPDMDRTVAERRLMELESLTATYGGIIVVKLIQKRSVPDYRTYVGSGKLTEIIEIGVREHADLLIVNNLLKPKQMFAIGEELRPHRMTVWDRIDLILKIFQKHATTAEAKLQIKLAAIRHMGPRIFGMGMEMMQQAGGIGTRGAGETNTEVMKRHLASQEHQLMKQLRDAARSRAVHRQRRDRLGYKTASIVGYTNAGKSSLLNALTRKGAYVADELFATLDTRVAKLRLDVKAHAMHSPTGSRRVAHTPTEILLSDTIGFIQDLPPELVRAFRSTLDETVEADLLLQVIDAADPFIHEKIVEVKAILEQLGATRKPTIYVFNKIDAVKRLGKTALGKRYSEMTPIFVSCLTGKGLEELKTTIAERLTAG